MGWLKSKKEAIINCNNDVRNALDDSLNYQNIERGLQRISKLQPSINKYNWEGIEFPAGPKDRKKFWQNNKIIALNISFLPHNTEIIRVAYRSEYNHKHKKQVILLIITDAKKWYYLTVTNLSVLLAKNHQIMMEIFIV